MLHGAVFTAWIALMVVQPMLIAARNIAPPPPARLCSAPAIAAAMVVLGNVAAVAAMHGGFIGLGDPLVFYAVPFFAINSFAVTVFFAVRWRNRAETHKRLILLSNAALIGAAIARIPLGAIQSGRAVHLHLRARPHHPRRHRSTTGGRAGGCIGSGSGAAARWSPARS